MAGRISGLYVAVTAAGAVLVWSGWKGATLEATFRALLHGNLNVPSTEDVTVSPDAGGSASGAAIATDALKYAGHPYVYGGPSNPDGGWDCSSFVSYVLGHDLGLQIPGGSWASETGNGAAHGPTAGAYLVWTGATIVPRSGVIPGDLLCWETHVGFASDSQHMISAYDTARGTLVTPITGAGPTGEVLVCRRVNATTTVAANEELTNTGTSTAAGTSEAQFVSAVLADMGAPATAANVSSLNAWITQEDGTWGNSGSAQNNPLNIGPGTEFSTLTVGAQETASLISSGAYPNIYMHLKEGSGLLTGCAADFAKWGTGGSGY